MSRSAAKNADAAPTRINSPVNDELLRWLDQAGIAVRATPWNEVLSSAGVDAWDSLISPLNLSLLHLVRGSAPHVVSGVVLSEQLRRWAYRQKARLREWRTATKAQPLQTVDVLFWPRDLTHIKAQLPVAAALTARGARVGFLACQPRIFDELQQLKLPTMFAPGSWPAATRQARSAGRRLARRLDRLPRPTLPPLRSAPNSTRVFETVKAVLQDGLPDVHLAMTHARGIVEQIKPGVLVVGYDITTEGRTACLVARQRGLPTASLMHGSVSGNPILGRHVADRVLVYGERARRELLRLGLSDAQIEICGAPYLDNRRRQTGSLNPTIQSLLKVQASQPLILVATSGPGHSVSLGHHEAVVDALTQLSAELLDVVFVAKLHRKDRVEYYERARQRHPDSRLRVIPSGTMGYPDDIFDWLEGCSLLITGSSAVANEAMFMDVPVVTMDFAGELAEVNFIQAEATTHVTNYAELEDSVKGIVQSGETAEAARQRGRVFMQEMYFALDGRSAERAADALLRLKSGT